ncbi:MAG: antibiotic resistance protein MarC, partial [Phenylobacterium zucineum]
WAGLGLGVAVISAVSLVMVAVFWAAPLISRILGRIGMSIVVRVLGLILCALAVQFVLIGVGDATRGLVRPDAQTPYATAK